MITPLLTLLATHSTLATTGLRTPPQLASLPGEATLDHQIGFLYVPVSLGNRAPQWFILDTGSYRSYVTARGMARLASSGVVPRKDGETGPLVASVNGVSLGATSFALDTKGFPVSLDPEADGILGLDLLTKNRIALDVRRERFRVWPTGETTPRALESWFGAGRKPLSTELWSRGDGTVAAWAILGNLTLPMCVDTGSEETYLARELASALRPNVRAGADRATFYSGVERVVRYRVDRVGLEGLPLRVMRPVGATRMPNIPGLLGTDVLGRLRLFLDFPRGELYFTGSGQPQSPVRGAPLRGPIVDLPTQVTIRYPRGEVVRVEPGCQYEAPTGYRRVSRPDGTFDLVPPGTKVPPFKPRPRLLVAPTVDGQPSWSDRPARVPPGSKYTIPPGWRKVKRDDGGLDLYPPAAGGRDRAAHGRGG